MEVSLFFKIVCDVIGGLGVFLLGMKYMSEGLQAVSGERLRKMISAVTSNRVMGVVVGLLVTCLVQSSSVTTVMVVGFVNSGIMTLMQAIGVILGANIGTTITGWILVLHIGKYGLPILGIAAFFFLFSKKERLRYIGMAIMGVGMVFFGLELMKNGFKPIRSMEEFVAWFHMFDATTYPGILKCVLVGCVLTMIVQSSSATLGITIGLASTGVIPFQTAAALVLGENIGTTITAWLASIGTNTNAKRAAYAHVFFNILGTTWFVLCFPFMINLVSGVAKSLIGLNPMLIQMSSVPEDVFEQVITAGIASVHTSFNVINTLVFIPLIGLLAKFVTRLVPDRAIEEKNRLTYLDVRMLDTPSLGIVQSKDQIKFMAKSTEEMLEQLGIVLTDETEHPESETFIFRREDVLDTVQKEIFVYLSRMVGGQIPRDITNRAHKQMRMADEYESLSDYIRNVLKNLKKLQDNELALDPDERDSLKELYVRVLEFLRKINRFVEDYDLNDLEWALSEGMAISALMKQIRREHLTRLQQGKVSPLFSLIYTDMLNNFRRMKDHALNISEVIAGEKG